MSSLKLRGFRPDITWLGAFLFIWVSTQFGEIETQYYQPMFSVQTMYPSASNFDSCQAARIPCGGHTVGSCQRYCVSSGYSKGMCDGSCCLCSTNNENDSGSAQQHGLTTTTQRPSFMNMNTAYFRRTGRSGSNPVLTMPRNILQLDFDQYFSGNQVPKSTQQNLNVPVINTIDNNSIYGKLPSRTPSYLQTKRPYQNNPTWDHPSLKKGICTSQVCTEEAKEIKSQMDERIDPCDDFYQFACGGFIRQHSAMAQDKAEVTQFSIIRDKVTANLRKLLEEPTTISEARPFKLVKNLYKSCMNTRLIESLGVKPLLETLNQVGGWPVLEPGWISRPEFRWENLAIWFKELGFGMNHFIKIGVEPDLRNSQVKYLTLGEPMLGLSDQLLKRGLNEPIVNSYYEYSVNMAELMGADRQRAKMEMLDAVNFEVKLSQCFYRHNNSRSGIFYNPMTIQDLASKYAQIPWLQLFQRIVPAPIKITDREIIMVSVPQYIDCFFKLLENTNQRTMVNYAIWRAVSASTTYLNEAARNLQHNFMAKITGQKMRTPRWQECTEIVSVNLGNAVGAMYSRRFFHDSSKAHALEMVKDIQKAFLDILNEADWMDAFTKEKAREKALEMLVHIGYPEEHKSDSKISALYAPFDFNPNDYFDNIRNLVIGATKVNFGKLREPIKRNDWISHGRSAVVNAFYQPQENSIQFPAAILQSHFFNASRPKYLNYAAIGWIVGHEVTHGFDDQGSEFDKFGNYLNWWAQSTKDTYNKKKQCIVDQYSSFQSQSTGLRLNGERSQGENIADNGGIKEAYRGYNYWTLRNGQEKGLPGLGYTPNQLFWISAAQNWCAVQRAESLKHSIIAGVHSPPEFRVRGTFANSVEFAKDFQCSAGKRMNPVKKCSVW